LTIKMQVLEDRRKSAGSQKDTKDTMIKGMKYTKSVIVPEWRRFARVAGNSNKGKYKIENNTETNYGKNENEN